MLRDAFGLSEPLVGFFVTATLLGYTAVLFPSGAAVDGFGEKPVLSAGLLVLAVAVVAVSFAPSYDGLLLSGVVLGAAYSTGMPGSNRGILATAPAGRENLAMGIKQVGVTAGSAVASVVITGIAAVAAWQLGFWIIAIVAGTYTLVFGVFYRGSSGSEAFSLPNLTKFRSNREYIALIAAGLFIGASVFAMLSYTVLYIEDGVEASAAVGGFVLALTQVSGSIARIGAGGLADRLGGARGAAIVVTGQIGFAVLFFGILALNTASLLVTSVVFAGLGVSIYGSLGVFYSCLSALVDPGEIGAATAAGQTAINTGGLLAPPVFGVLITVSGYRAGWTLLCAATLLASILLIAVLRRV